MTAHERTTPTQVLPRSWRSRIARRFRPLRRVRGYSQAMSALVPSDPTQSFVVPARHGWFAGNLGSLIDREVFLHGAYEEDKIAAFLAALPPGRRGVALDIGANVGNHSLAFRGRFGQVHAFEPNAAVWAGFERNMALNAVGNVTLHKVAVSREDRRATLYTVEGSNLGAGTLSAVEQYGAPLRPAAEVSVVHGDGFLAGLGIRGVDAVKIDVQGHEREVLEGLRETLMRDRPWVWVEVGEGQAEPFADAAALLALFPYPATIHRFDGVSHGVLRGMRLVPVTDAAAPLRLADYLVRPAEGAAGKGG